MRSGSTPTLSQVRAWQPWCLTAAGQEMAQRSNECVTLVEHAVTRIRDASSYWQGEAYYAAYDRIAGDRDQAKKASQEIAALAQTLTDSGSLLTGYRQTLLDRVSDATTAGFAVAEDWTVSAARSSDTEQIHTYQSAVSTALNEMMGIQTTALAKIEQANANVANQAEHLGSASVPASQAVGSGQSKTSTAATSPASAAAPLSTEAQASQPSKQNSTGSASGQQQDSSTAQTQNPSKPNSSGADTSKTGQAAGSAGTGNSSGGASQNGSGGASQNGSGGASQSSDKGKPGEWRPGDISDLIKAVSSITGNIPDLIESSGEFLKDTGELVKNGGEAVAKVTDSVTKLVTTVDQVTHHSSTGSSEQSTPNSPADKNNSGAAAASPEKNTAAPATAPSDKSAAAAPNTPTPDKTRAADWNPQAATTTTAPSIGHTASTASSAASQPILVGGVSAGSPMRRRHHASDRTASISTLDLPDPLAQKSDTQPHSTRTK